MKKLIILTSVFVFLLSGCVEEKKAELTTENPQDQKEITTEKNTAESPVKTSTDSNGQDALADQRVSAEETKEELQKLSDVLQGLTDGDFSDIDYTE